MRMEEEKSINSLERRNEGGLQRKAGVLHHEERKEDERERKERKEEERKEEERKKASRKQRREKERDKKNINGQSKADAGSGNQTT